MTPRGRKRHQDEIAKKRAEFNKGKFGGGIYLTDALAGLGESKRGSLDSKRSSGSPFRSGRDKDKPPYSLDVKNLPEDVSNKDLFKHFRDQGFRLKAAHVLEEDKSKGKLDFFNGVEADRCIKSMNKTVFKGKKLTMKDNNKPPPQLVPLLNQAKDPNNLSHSI
jgi:RNA recognition motif-containing protein